MKTLTLTSTGRTGKQWAAYLKKKGFRIGDYAESILLNPDFDRLNDKKGKEYTLAIVPFKDMGIGNYPTTAEVKGWVKMKGYTLPTPEMACLVREALTDEEMKEMDVWYTVALHEPIADRDGSPGVLRASRGGDGRWLGAFWDEPGDEWGTDGASVLSVPASTQDLEPSASTENLGTLTSRVEEIEKILKHHHLGL